MQPILKKFIDEVGVKVNPKIQIIEKDKTWWMRVLSWFFVKSRINPAFETYYTTIGNKIHAPVGYDSFDDKGITAIIMHEVLHIKDAKTFSRFLFSISYLLPQILALLTIPVMFMFGWWGLLFLAFLAPIPAYFRYIWELRAFRIQILLSRKVFNYSEEEMQGVRDFIKTNLSESYYYFAMPFKNKIEKDLRDESFIDDPYYKEFLDFAIKNMK